MEIKELIADNLISILGCIFGGGSFYGFWIERKKRKIEEKQLGADAIKTMQEAYDRFTEDALNQYQELKIEISGLKIELKTVTDNLLTEQDKYLILKAAYAKLKLSYNTLKRNFDNYKKNNRSED